MQSFRRSISHPPLRYPIVLQPDGSVYSVSSAGILVQVLGDAPPIFGLRVRIQQDSVTVANGRDRPVTVAVAPVQRDSDGRLSPSTDSLTGRTGVKLLRAGEALVLDAPSGERPMLCVGFGQTEGIDTRAKFHAELPDRRGLIGRAH